MRNFGTITTGPLAGEPYASDLRQFELLDTDGSWVTFHLKERELVILFNNDGRIILSVQYWQHNDREFDLNDNHRVRVIDWLARTEEEQSVCMALKRTHSPLLSNVFLLLRDNRMINNE